MATKKNVGVQVGRWFHSTESDGKTIRWQGYVWKHVGGPKDLYLLALYEWFVGQEDVQWPLQPTPGEPRPENVKRSENLMRELVSSENMRGWRFYDSQEEMQAYYREYCTRRGYARRKTLMRDIRNW